MDCRKSSRYWKRMLAAIPVARAISKESQTFRLQLGTITRGGEKRSCVPPSSGQNCCRSMQQPVFRDYWNTSVSAHMPPGAAIASYYARRQKLDCDRGRTAHRRRCCATDRQVSSDTLRQGGTTDCIKREKDTTFTFRFLCGITGSNCLQQ